MRSRHLARWAGLLVLAAAGCEPKPAAAPTLTVTLDGKPADRLIVQLVGADGRAAATGYTDAAGRAVVRGGDGGAPAPGPYKVVVAEAGEDEPDPMAPQKGKPAPRFDRRYTKADSTPAAVTIEAGKLDYSVELKAKP